MNDSQDRRKQELEEEKKKAVDLNVEKLTRKIESGQRFVLSDGLNLGILEEVLNRISHTSYNLKQIFSEQVMIQHQSKIQTMASRGKPQGQVVTFYYPLFEKS